MTIHFREEAGSPVEVYDGRGIRAQRRLVCAWTDRQALVRELLGDGRALGGVGAAGYPGIASLVAARVRVAPLGDDAPDETLDDVAGQLNHYESFARVTVDYEALQASEGPAEPVTAEPRTYLSARIEPADEELPLLPAGLRWEADAGLPVPADLGLFRRVPVLVHQRVWQRVAEPPLEAVRACLGKVNAAEFLGAAAETLLFDGCGMEREWVIAPAGEPPQATWRLTYYFRERRIEAGGNVLGWNHAYRPAPAESAGWDRPLDLGGNPIYPLADFAPLFRFP